MDPGPSKTRSVRDIMTPDIVRVAPDTSIEEIAGLIWSHGISGLPVADEAGRVLGIVTDLDLVIRYTRFKPPPSFTLLDATIYLETPRHIRERLQHMLGTTAREIMTAAVVTIGPDASLEELAELMVDRRANPIPVVEGDRLVGIVSRADLVRVMAQSSAGP